MKEKILIVKLGYSETLDAEISRESSLGDVLRTTVILHFFKDQHVTWLVDEKAYPLLEGNPFIDRILLFNLSSTLQLRHERFDTVINFEKVPGICALADSINAWKRFGFRFDEIRGEAQPYGGAEQVYQICQDTKIKRNHTKYWQESLYEMVGAQWKGEEYILGYKPASVVKFDVGLNWAVGSKWPNKVWPKKCWKELEGLIKGNYSYQWQKGLENINKYIDWINSCKILVTTDSLGAHIAVALKKKLLILYGPTHAGETYLYDRGIEVFPDCNYDCIPCLSPQCRQEKVCMEFISPENVFAKLTTLL